MPTEPGTHGTPAAFMVALALALSPIFIDHIWRGTNKLDIVFFTNS